jgi:hypothetical protein
MPLINLRTDLKSLKYGKDTPGGGYSGQPYIQAKIPDGLEPKSPDFILRGGYLTPADALEDIKRLGKMFGDLKSPNGLLFIAKQNVLSNSAVRTQTSGILNEGIYTPLSTLAQAGVVAFGGHLNKQGINPFEQTGAYASNEYLYYNKISQYNLDWINSGGATALDNRLFALYESRILNNSIGGYAKPNNINVDLKNTVLTYGGGPGSILGVGQTNIRFEDNGNKRTGVNNVQLLNSGFFGQRKQVPIPGTPFFSSIIETPKNPAAGNYSVFRRPNDRTSDLFITPYGVTDAYEAATGQLLPQGPNPEGVITKNGGYTFDPSFAYNVYKPGTLTPNAEVTGSQKIRKSVDSRSGIQAAGQKIDVLKPWTKRNIYPTPSGEIVSISLPNTNVNTPQNSSSAISNKGIISDENVYTYSGTLTKSENVNPPTGDHLSPKTQDFRAVLRNNLQGTQKENANKSGATTKSLSYNIGDNQTIEGRTNLGNPGARANKNYSSYTAGVQGDGRSGQPLDRINASAIYTSKTGPETLGPAGDLLNDLISFRIGAINNSNPTIVSYMHFRAFLDSFTDSYTGDWSGYNYLGRGEKFYTYNGFDRKISLGFTAAAQSKEELIPMYKKLNFLASNLAPDYSGEYGYMKGCFITLTIGGYLYEQPGFITNLSYDMITEMPWEIGINDTNGAQDPLVKQLSHMVKINSFDFTPIHNFIPQKQSLGVVGNSLEQVGREEYIALANPNDGSTNWAKGKSINSLSDL